MRKYITKSNLFISFKIALSSVAAILIARALNLQFAVSAGIVAILSVAPTKKETIKTALSRFTAFIVALALSFICFEIFGYNVEAFLVYLTVFVFICQFMKWNSAMAMDSVLISHFITLGDMNFSTVMNESLIFIIGAGLGIAVNLHLHKDTGYVEKMKEETDKQIKLALHRMSKRILEQNLKDYNGSCFKKLNKSVRKAKSIAKENFMNQFGSMDTWDIEYISMRERQIHVLYSMYKRVRLIHTQPITAKEISDYLEKMSRTYHRDNSGEELLEEFYRMHDKMKESPLPVTREEFEDRAELYALMKDIEEFLIIKKEFAEKNSNKDTSEK